MKANIKKATDNLFKLVTSINCETFHVFMDFMPHCSVINLKVHLDGWEANKTPSKEFSFYYDEDEKSVLSYISSTSDQLIALKSEHDIRYSPENITKQKEAAKSKRIKSLKAQLAELEK